MSIDFHHFKASPSGRRVCLLLTKKNITPEKFANSVLEAVKFILPALQKKERYSTEELCGPNLWGQWQTAEHRCAGMCLTYFIENQMLPLESAKPAGKYPLRFRLKTLP